MAFFKLSVQPKPKSPDWFARNVSYTRLIVIGMPASGMFKSVNSSRKLPMLVLC